MKPNPKFCHVTIPLVFNMLLSKYAGEILHIYFFQGLP